MNRVNFVVLITTHNNVDDIDKTVESVWAQNFPKENIWIYIIDFESTDGTYEKVLGYNRYHTAAFQLPDMYDERARESRAISLVNTQLPVSAVWYMVSLKPGDMLYESCFSVSSKTLARWWGQGAVLMICEADIMDQNGNTIRQSKIAGKEILFDSVENIDFLLGEFSCQYVGYIGGKVFTLHHSFPENERCFWNKIYSAGETLKFVYSPETLLCQKERLYRDEVEELMVRWVQVMNLQRGIQATVSRDLTPDLTKVNRNLANYSLWRLGKRYHELTQKEREDLLYLAELIDSEIVQEKIYMECKEKVEKGIAITGVDLERYLEDEHRKGREAIEAAVKSGILISSPRDMK